MHVLRLALMELATLPFKASDFERSEAVFFSTVGRVVQRSSLDQLLILS